MSLFKLMGLASTLALAIPIIILISARLTWYRSFPALLFYYLILLTFNLLLLDYIKVDYSVKYYHAVVNNLLDTPLILSFLLYFSKTLAFRKKLVIAILSFIAFEIIIVMIYGFNTTATTIILAPGLIISLVISLLFFIHQVKIAVVYHKAAGKAIIAASLLFTYVGYCFVYSVFYLIKPAYKDDAHLVFFLITIFSSIAMSVGIYLERKRVQQLIELQTTREELKAIYGEQTKKMAAPFESAIFNFDKKQWN